MLVEMERQLESGTDKKSSSGGEKLATNDRGPLSDGEPKGLVVRLMTKGRKQDGVGFLGLASMQENNLQVSEVFNPCYLVPQIDCHVRKRGRT